MDYDQARVRERIQYIETNLTRLEALRGLPKDEFLADFCNVESAKHLLQTAIEAMMDIGNHILARRRLVTSHEGAETFRRQYVQVPQKEYEQLQPDELAALSVFAQ